MFLAGAYIVVVMVVGHSNRKYLEHNGIETKATVISIEEFSDSDSGTTYQTSIGYKAAGSY